MRLVSKFLVASVLVGLLAVTVAACGSNDSASGDNSTTASSSGEPLKVVSIYPFSGPAAIYGKYDDQAWQLAFEKFGDKVSGRPVERERLDDKCTPSEAISAVRQVLGSDTLVSDGPGCSGSIAAAKDLVATSDLPVVTLAFTPEIVGPGNKQIWQSVPNDAVLNDHLADHIAEQGYQRVGIIHDTNGYGQEQARTLTDALAKHNLKPATVVTYETGATDFSGQISRLKSGNVDAVFLAGYEAEIGRAAAQMRKLGLDAPLIGPDTASTTDFLKAAGKAATEGVVFATPFLSNRPEAKDFTAAWTEKFGDPPPIIAAAAYVNAMVILNSLQEAGQSPDRTSINEAIKSMKLDIPEMGITVAFNDEGAQLCPPILIGQWKDSKQEVIEDATEPCS